MTFIARPRNARATTLRLNRARFTHCLNAGTSGSAQTKVKGDVALATELNISGTPMFLIGFIRSDGRVQVRRSLPGFQTVAQMQIALDEILAEVDSSTKGSY